jgi:cytochrome c biogenesis protein CcdA/thiol-disulfide isomerase/thioredoxin
MILFLLAYLGGVLTILSPCILPVLPFVFAQADQPFLRSGLPMLVGMAATFAVVASLAAVAGGWAVEANAFGRWAALVLLAGFGLTLVFPSLSDYLTRPLVSLGDRLSASADRSASAQKSTIAPSLLLGVATGLLWAPCAGPVLGLILTGAALQGANAGTSLLLLAYAAGAATSLALALLVGGRVFAAMKRSLGIGEWIRRGIGVAVLAGVAAIAFGLDTGFLSRVSYASTASIEQKLLDGLRPTPASPPPSSMAMAGGAAMSAVDSASGAENPAMMMKAKPTEPNVVMNGGAMMSANPPAGDNPAMMMKAKPAEPSVVMNDGGAMMSANPAGSDNPAMMMKAKPTEPSAVEPSTVMNGGGAMMSANPAMMKVKPTAAMENLPDEGPAPSLAGAVEWLNSPPLTMEALKGKVVLVDFWTYSCINCLRAIPYVRAWADKYRDQGLVVIGVHAPEFAFEKNVDNVRKAVADLKIDYPVAIDNNYAIWRASQNEYWPAHYFIDAQGRVRHHHFGEGDYDESERVIQELLAEAGKTDVSSNIVAVNASGAEAAADMKDVQSPETYIGYTRADNFVSPGGAVPDAPHLYEVQAPKLNEWGVAGNWTIGGESATLNQKGGAIAYRFHARDLHLVLGPGPEGAPVHFRVTIDGAAPGTSHGADVDAEGMGVVEGQRLYQLVRQDGAIGDHTFRIEFLDPGVQAFAFTFG